MNVELRGRKRLEKSCDFLIWKVLGGGGALRGLKCLTYDGVVYFYFRYPLLAGGCFLRDSTQYCSNSINSSVTHHRGSEIDEILTGHRSQGPATKSPGQSKNWVLFFPQKSIFLLLTSFEQLKN